MPVLILNQQNIIPVRIAALKRFLQCCLKKVQLSRAELSVVLTDDSGIQILNHQHRGLNRPTDILSFGMREQRQAGDPLPPTPEILGDLVVSVPTVQRQALSRQVSLETELEFICLHGLLHLIGYDHADQVQEKRMTAVHANLLMACQRKRGI